MREPDGGASLSVDPDELTGCGQSAQRIAEQIPGETAKPVGPADQVTHSLSGWATASALHDCTADWKTLLDGLSKDMDGYGGKLITMAQNYRTTDQSAADTLNAAGRPTTQAAVVSSEVPYVQPAGGPDPFGTRLSGRQGTPVLLTTRPNGG